MNRQKLINQIEAKGSYLCIGLDTDIQKIPNHLLDYEDPLFEFNKQIIDATHQYAVAYKPNVAFYEVRGWKGWQSLQKTQHYIASKGCFSIADAKRGDIGNTSTQYAKAFFETMDFDALTVAPYMGSDSVEPFLQYKDKWIVLLALTSNEGAQDFQFYGESVQRLEKVPAPLYLEVLKKAKTWGNADDTMFVVGATKSAYLQQVRQMVPNHFLLIPGVGAQGGSLEEVSKHGLIKRDCGLLVNLSRSIIYVSTGEDFAETAAVEAKKVQQDMQEYLKMYC